jgi:hypothetical protein
MLDRIPPHLRGALATIVATAAAALGYTLTEQAAAAVVVVIVWAIGGLYDTVREWDRGAK